MLKEILDSKQEAHVSSGKFSISSVNGCWRKIYLTLKKEYREEYSEGTKRIFSTGNIIHREIIKEIIEKGTGGIQLVAAELNIPEQKYISGRIDAVLSDGTKLYICDVKSCSKWTMDKIREGDIPENYKNQVLLYMYFTGIHNGFLLFVEKTKCDIEEVQVDYDEEKAKRLVAEIENFFTEFVEKNVLPERCDCITSPFGCPACDGTTK
jgi:hypothetical protein